MDSASLSGRSARFLNRSEPFNDLKLHMLIPPGVWAELLPKRTETTASDIEKSTKAETVTKKNVKRPQKLQIMAAVCGIHDVTSELQQMAVSNLNGNDLYFAVDKISDLEKKVSSGRFIPRETTNLSIIYKYTDGPVRVCSVDHDERSAELCEITQTSQHQEVKGVYSVHGCKLFCVIYGGKVYHTASELQRLVVNAYFSDSQFRSCIRFNKETVGDNYSGTEDITGVVFYEYINTPGVQSVVSLGNSECVLRNQRQLVNLAEEAIKKDTNRAKEKGNDELKRYVVGLHKDIVVPGESRCIPILVLAITFTSGYSCTFKPGTIKVSPSESPFLKFENGVKFFFRCSGEFQVLDGNGKCLWSSNGAPLKQSARLLESGCEGTLKLWTDNGEVYWSRSTTKPWSPCRGSMALSSEWPYLEIYDMRGNKLWRAEAPEEP
jgi:hypothetical protein